MEKDSFLNVLNRSITYIILIVLLIFTLFPFYIVLLMAFKTPSETFASFYALPKTLYIDNIIKAWNMMHFTTALFNSLFITVTSTIVIVIVTSLAGYAIARKNTIFYNILYIIFIAGLTIPFQVTMVPLYKLGKTFGLVNNYYGIIFIYACLAVQSSVFLYTGFVKTVPRELEEAAFIDGCSFFRTFWQIVFPLLKPVTSTVIIINALYIWNDFLLPLIWIQKTSMMTIPLMQYNFYGEYNTNLNLAFAGFLLALIPIAIFYFLMQGQIVKGITAGAVKG